MLPEFLSFGTIDGFSFAELGLAVSGGTDTFKNFNNPKEGYSYEWAGSDGIQFDETGPVFKQARNFKLNLWLLGDSIEDFDAKFDFLQDLFLTPGSREIYCKKFRNTVFAKVKTISDIEIPKQCYYETSNYIGAEFTLEMIETFTGEATLLAPLVNAGANRNIVLPTSSVTISGASTTPRSGSTIVSRVWAFVSGPATPTITSGTTLTPTFSDMTEVGAYVFRLTAEDSNALTGTDTMTVNVLPEGSTPEGFPYTFPLILS